jgi:hypothetical protein
MLEAKQTIDVYYLSLKKDTPNRDYWDYTFLDDVFSGKAWHTANLYFKTHEVAKLPNAEQAIVVIPARHHANMVAEINTQLQKIDHCILFLMGDEEADYPVEEIRHPSIDIWIQNPHPDKHHDYDKLGCGYAPKPPLPKEMPQKRRDLFFSGQITHQRRRECYASIRLLKRSEVHATEGFTQGMEPARYWKQLGHAKTTAAPSGAVIPDSFRLHEALEMMTIPLADNRNSQQTVNNYWRWLYINPPFPTIDDWSTAEEIVNSTVDNYDQLVIQQSQWWLEYKRNVVYRIRDQLHV